jgi:hypothetical protein
LAAPQQVRPVPTQNVPLLSCRQQTCLSLGFHGRGKIFALGCGDLFRLREWDGAPGVNRLIAGLLDDALRPLFSSPANKLAVHPATPRSGATAHIVAESAAEAIFDDGFQVALKYQPAAGGGVSEALLPLKKPGPVTIQAGNAATLLFRSLASVSLEDVHFGLDPAGLTQLAELAVAVVSPNAKIPKTGMPR